MDKSYAFDAVMGADAGVLSGYLEQCDYPTVWNLSFLACMAPADAVPVLFTLKQGDRLCALALGMYRRRFPRSFLLLPTSPRFLVDDLACHRAFWQGISGFCRQTPLARVLVNSYEAPDPFEPLLPQLVASSERCEYYIDLTQDTDSLFSAFSTSHRRNVRKGKKQDFQLSVSTDERCLEDHLKAFSHTAARRANRNESVPDVNEKILRALLASGDAIVMQLHLDEAVVCSMYIILTPTSAFYFSGGTTPEGSKMGAFHYLIWLAIEELKGRGVASLTLGGTDAQTPDGLRRFKLGFNARDVELAHREYLLGNGLLVALLRFAEDLRDDLPGLGARVRAKCQDLLSRCLHVQRWELYAAVAEPQTSEDRPELELRKLEPADYQVMLSQGGRFEQQARLYHFQRGIDTAYGVFVNGELAHVSWVYTATEYAREPVAQLTLRPDEAEISNCYTLEKFRGQNLYAYAIKAITRRLLAAGTRRVYMKAEPDNEASRKGILKAGFAHQGTASLLGGGLARLVPDRYRR